MMSVATKFELLDFEGRVLFAGVGQPIGVGGLDMPIPPALASQLHSLRVLDANGNVLDEVRLRSTAEELAELLRSRFERA